MTDLLAWLQDFYRSLCDGEWEGENGISIETIDQPGWLVEIDLDGTALATVKFKPVEIERSEEDWLQCHVESGCFVGAGGTGNLAEILQTFGNWAEAARA